MYPTGFVDQYSAYDEKAFVAKVNSIVQGLHADGTLKKLSVKDFFGVDYATKAGQFDLAVIRPGCQVTRGDGRPPVASRAADRVRPARLALRLPRRGLMVRLVGSFLVLSVLMVVRGRRAGVSPRAQHAADVGLRSSRRRRRAEVRRDQQLARRPAPERRLRRAAPRRHRIERRPAAEAAVARAALARRRRAATRRNAHDTILQTLNGVVSQTADAEEYLVLDENGKVRLSTTPVARGRLASRTSRTSSRPARGSPPSSR